MTDTALEDAQRHLDDMVTRRGYLPDYHPEALEFGRHQHVHLPNALPDYRSEVEVSNCVEFVRFRVKEGQRSAFLARRGHAVAAVQAAHPELIGAPVLAEHDDGSWTDVWIYRTAEAAERAGADGGNIPAFIAMAELLEDVRIEVGAAPEGTAPEGADKA